MPPFMSCIYDVVGTNLVSDIDNLTGIS